MQKYIYKITNLFNISISTLSRINLGKILKKDYLVYPIRSSSERVYKPVETIPS